ncbi:sugar-binding domain-containing protein [uncultured Duncaniella sp.]|uniref:sugar-binding domain-containing protein n=1 Tax=uncultured Duncaniella sp. TaxID=2768039 RepID=UPI00272CC52A|nr:sugar-binding domain-containing protein [uncultured Duncaniella sp.]
MRHIIPLFALTVALGATAERICIDNDWRFAFGHTDPARDYGSGTEYFNYLTKAASVHNIGPYAMKFNDSTWTEVDLPHDFVADLPFAREASHSHGYKTVGYKYPETSVGWYRKVLPVAAEDSVMRLSLVFDGIFRDSRVWFNGFYLGGEPSGYTQQTYDITPYVNWGGDNVIAVRSDATLEEGWFYEGGGIYRHAWLDRKAPRHIADNSIATSFVDGPNSAVTVSGRIANRLYGVDPADNETWTLNAVLIDPQGNKAAEKTIDITGQLRRMIDRDRNHPSVIMWSVGNEEWGVEWDEKGRRIVSELRDVCHRLDPTRPMTVATSGGPMPIIPADVAGYNYIMQNPVEKYRAEYPARCAYGSEETSGCGTRGVYFDDRENGRMASLNRIPDSRDSCLNRIERGWRFYADRPWLAGLFYWTGFDYRGEPNPLEYPATGSEFGLLDYCGFPKDEAWYLKSWWTDEPVLYVFPTGISKDTRARPSTSGFTPTWMKSN